MYHALRDDVLVVNCRVGSLEKTVYYPVRIRGVNCRVGSLENHLERTAHAFTVNCRVGSLEMIRLIL